MRLFVTQINMAGKKGTRATLSAYQAEAPPSGESTNYHALSRDLTFKFKDPSANIFVY